MTVGTSIALARVSTAPEKSPESSSESPAMWIGVFWKYV